MGERRGRLFDGGAYLLFWPRGWALIRGRAFIRAWALVRGNTDVGRKKKTASEASREDTGEGKGATEPGDMPLLGS